MLWRPIPFAVAAILILSAVACSPEEDQAADPTVPIVGHDDAIDLGEITPPLDEVITMTPGGSETPSRFRDRESDLAFSRQILEGPGSEGSTRAFEVVASIEGRQQRCLVVESDADGGHMQCGAPESGLDRGPDILTGSSGGSPRNPPALQSSMFVLVGPAETTHFIVETAGHRVAVVAADGIAVIVRPEAVCLSTPTLIEAWADNELLLTEKPPRRQC